MIPPTPLIVALNRIAPGLLSSFVHRVVAAHQGIPSDALPTLTSWWRDDAHNARVGGHPESQHLLALGADFVYPVLMAKEPAASNMRRLGLVVVDEGDHVHVQALTPDQNAALRRALGLVFV